MPPERLAKEGLAPACKKIPNQSETDLWDEQPGTTKTAETAALIICTQGQGWKAISPQWFLYYKEFQSSRS